MAYMKRLDYVGNTRREVAGWLSDQGYALRRGHSGVLPVSDVWDYGCGAGYSRVWVRSEGYGANSPCEVYDVTPEGCVGCHLRGACAGCLTATVRCLGYVEFGSGRRLYMTASEVA